MQERIEVRDDALVETIELMALVLGHAGIRGYGAEQTGGQRCVDTLEELEEDHADRVALRAEPIAPGVRDLFDEAFGSQLGQVVAYRGESILIGGHVEGGGSRRMEIARREAIATRNVGEADEGVHYGQFAAGDRV